MKTVIRKAAVITLAVLCFGILGLTIFLDEYFYRYRPREPELASGRVYPEVIHAGTRVYLTRIETFPFEYLVVCLWNARRNRLPLESALAMFSVVFKLYHYPFSGSGSNCTTT